MVKLVLALLFVCLAVTSDVVVLNEGNFPSSLEEHANLLVEFYAPWCGHCKALAPEWEKAATQLKGKVTVAKVDCTVEQELCKQKAISGYPTILFFKNGNPTPFGGERTSDGIASWVLKKIGDAYVTVTSSDSLSELLSQGTVVLGFFNNKDSDVFKSFSSISQEVEDVTFAAVFDASVSRDFVADTVSVHAGGSVTYFDGKGELSSFVLDYAFPLVDKLSQKGFERFIKNHKKYFVLLFAPQVDPLDSVKLLGEVAVSYRKELGFLWDLGEQYAQHASKLGFSGTQFPTIVAMNDREKFFPMAELGELTAASIKAYLDDLLEGKIAQYSQSQPIPESNDGPVKVVVGENYNEVVKQSPNDVFLEVYAPWCGHCKSLAPIWDQLGEKLHGKSSVVIAKVDATANDIPLEIKGYPTILFFKAGNKESPISFDGARDLDSLYAFVKEHSSSNLKDEL